MTGTLVETKKGFAVRSEYLAENGTTYVSYRLVNGANGTPLVDSSVRYAGSDTWDGKGFTVATNPLPEETLGEEIAPKQKKTKRRKN